MKLTIVRLDTLTAQDAIDLQKIWPTYSSDMLQPNHDARLYAARFNDRLLAAVRVSLSGNTATLKALRVRDVTRRRGVGRYLVEERCAITAPQAAGGCRSTASKIAQRWRHLCRRWGFLAAPRGGKSAFSRSGGYLAGCPVAGRSWRRIAGRRTRENSLTAVSQSASQPVSQSASQPVSQSASQPVSQSASQPVSQSANQPISQSANQPISQSANQPISQSANQPISQSANQSISQSANQPISIIQQHLVCAARRRICPEFFASNKKARRKAGL